MGQAILIKAGFGGGNGGSNSGEDANITGWHVKTEIITTNGYFSVPKAKNQEFHVRLFGGGGGAGGMSTNSKCCGGGGGGNMNNSTLILNKLDSVQVSIGKGGSFNGVGGTTAFGTYLSATGGRSCNVGYYEYNSDGGCGGTGGGGCTYIRSGEYGGVTELRQGVGGNATYGGGGGSYFANTDSDDVKIRAGGLGGIYGGNGSSTTGNVNNGTNTIGMPNLDFVGEGKAGDTGMSSFYHVDKMYSGGGGYGGCGGSKCGGGGGYGADGGNGYSGYRVCGGGGGGYGGKGGDASNGYAGYGGGYGPENYGRGGGSAKSTLNGKSGVCIITYQAPVYSN